MIIEDQMKQVQSEMNEKKQVIDRIKKTDSKNKEPIQDKLDKIQIQTHAHKIKNETIKMNVTKTQNKKLRADIDMLRKELMSKQDECNRLIKKTNKAKKLAEE